MSRIHPVLRKTSPYLEQQFGSAAAQTVLDFAQAEYKHLCQQHAGDPKAVRTHTESQIYPCVSLYRGLHHAGIGRQEAVAFLDKTWSLMAQPNAAVIRAICRIPGFYRLMPRIFRSITLNTFGEAAGFKATFYPTGNDRVKFDMTQCLYCDTCRKLGCPELVPCFCHTDDVTDGNMHPRLCWNRTKIMGDGGDCCDFDLFITEKKTDRA